VGRPSATRLFLGFNVALAFAMYACGRGRSGVPVPYAALHPFATGGLIYAMLRSAAKTLARGGIEWRDTSYPLDELKGAP
jgi:hypothetical protein